MINSMFVASEKPSLRVALVRAREFCRMSFDPPITRAEIYSVYRQARHGSVFFRCRFDSQGIASRLPQKHFVWRIA